MVDLLNKNILVVGVKATADDPNVKNIAFNGLKKKLRKIGADIVDLSDDGGGALERLGALKYGLVVIDHAPEGGVDAVELTKSIRNHKKQGGLPILVMVDGALKQAEDTALRLSGCVEVMVKRSDVNCFERGIENVLELREKLTVKEAEDNKRSAALSKKIVIIHSDPTQAQRAMQSIQVYYPGADFIVVKNVAEALGVVKQEHDTIGLIVSEDRKIGKVGPVQLSQQWAGNNSSPIPCVVEGRDNGGSKGTVYIESLTFTGGLATAIDDAILKDVREQGVARGDVAGKGAVEKISDSSDISKGFERTAQQEEMGRSSSPARVEGWSIQEEPSPV